MRAWAPIVTGDVAERARSVVADIAAALSEVEPIGADLSTGAAGMAVFFSYLAMVTDDDAAYSRAVALLELAGARVASQVVTSSLFGGYTGIGWTLAHLTDQDPDGGDPNGAIDRAVASALATQAWDGDYDLINGLAGIALYALERLPRSTAVEALGSVVGHLEHLAEARNGLVTWFTPPALLAPMQVARAPHGFYNFGVSHGVPAVINVLGRIVAAGIAVERARPLLDGAVRWLLAQPRHDDDSRFPYWVAEGTAGSGATRNAWCYGDLGVAAALFGAARFVDRADWETIALELARAAAQRPVDRCGVVDAGLCHGAFGLAHMLGRFFHATGEVAFRSAAAEWIERGLERRRTGGAFAGFPMWDGMLHAYVPDPGFLTGAAGIGLALLAATSDVEPAWDRLLLLDAPAQVRAARDA